MLSRILHGARISLTIGVVAASIPLVIGTLMGAIAGYYGGVYDTLIMRFIDMLLAFPGILSAILIIAIAGPGVDSVIVAVGIFGIPETARLIRGSVLSTREREFVDSARVVGLPGPFILAKYILPNCIAPVIVLTTLNIGTAILTAAALSFLGLGVQPPQPEWGAMVSAGRSYMRVAPHLTTIPGLVVFMVVLGFNLLGDGLRDALDPRLKTESRKGAA